MRWINLTSLKTKHLFVSLLIGFPKNYLRGEHDSRGVLQPICDQEIESLDFILIIHQIVDNVSHVAIVFFQKDFKLFQRRVHPQDMDLLNLRVPF